MEIDERQPGYQCLSMRLRRPVHELMKNLASERGLRAAEFYVQTVGTFIRDDLQTCRHIFAVENDAAHVTIIVPIEFAKAVRQAAHDRCVSANELIYTAVCHKVDELSERAA